MHEGFIGKFAKNAGLVGSAMLGISLIALIDSGFSIGWTYPFKKILEQYNIVMLNIEYVMSPAISYIVKRITYIFNLDLYLRDNWSDIFVLMMVYLLSRVKSYISDGKYVRSVFMLILTCLISVFSCINFTYEINSKYLNIFVISSIPLLGFLVYDIFYAVIGSIFDRRSGSKWIKEFVRHLQFSLPVLPICLIFDFIIALISVEVIHLDQNQIYTIIFVLNYFLISVFWLFMSFRHASKKENRQLGESVYKRMQRSSATNVSLNVGIVLFSATVFMLGNAGLKAAGVD